MKAFMARTKLTLTNVSCAVFALAAHIFVLLVSKELVARLDTILLNAIYVNNIYEHSL